MIISGIYQIQSKSHPERVYIGSAVNIRKRWEAHLWHLRNKKHHTSKLQRHFSKYGESDFIFTILQKCHKEYLLLFEQLYLDSTYLYFNTCLIAGNTLGVKATHKTRRKLSRLAMGNKGRRGIPLTQAHKDKISNAQMGENNSMYGKPSPNKGKKGHPNPNKGLKGIYSEETLAKMRVSNKRAWEARKQNKIVII